MEIIIQTLMSRHLLCDRTSHCLRAGSSALALALATAAAVGSPASAQEAASPPSSPSAGPAGAASSSQLGEVIVTARRRSEALSKVPISVAALDAGAIQKHTVTQEQDLQRIVPGLTVKTTGSQNQLNYTIRGQTLDAFSGSSPGVLAYVNDVQISSQTANALYDLASIQVLKGPQGTLFGRNATGGAVLYGTTQPGDTYSGRLLVRLGDYRLRHFEAAVDLPLVHDVLAVRVALFDEQQDGYVKNIQGGSTLGDKDVKSGRLTVKWTPTENFSDVTVFQYGNYGGTNLPGQIQSFNPLGSTYRGTPLNATGAAIYGDAALAGAIRQQQALGPYRTALVGGGQPFRSNTRYLENTAVYQVSPDLQFKNIASTSNSHTRTNEILSGSPYSILDLVTPGFAGTYFGISQWSEEAQALGHALDGKLEYIVGAYAASEIDNSFVPVTVGLGMTPPIAAFSWDYRNKDRTQALYTQGTYDLSSILSGLKFTAGVRYTWEQLALTQKSLSPSPNYPRQSTKESKPSWQVGLQYQVLPSTLLYAVNRGSWRSGNFNGTAAPTNNANQFGPETTYDFEVGAKFSGRVAGKPARLNVALYDQIVKNVQRDVYFNVGGVPQSATDNVPQAEIKGVEADGSYRLTDWLTLAGNVAYTEAKYTKPTLTLFGDQITFQDYQDTPKWAGSVSADIDLPTPANWGDMTLHADAYAQTKTYYSSLAYSLIPGTDLPSYYLVNLRYDWRHVFGSQASLGAFAKNVTGEKYYLGGYALGAAIGFNTHIPAAPRMFGVELGYEF